MPEHYDPETQRGFLQALGDLIPQRASRAAGPVADVWGSPFVQDTVAGLLGGQLPPTAIAQNHPAMRVANPFSPDFGEPAGGMATRIPRGVVMNDIPGMSDRQIENNLIHEYGHVFDFRQMEPDLVNRVKSRFEKGDTHRDSNADEFFAHAFTDALNMLRMLGSPHMEDELRNTLRQTTFERQPEIVELMDWMSSQEIFADHPYTRMRRASPQPDPNAGASAR